MSKVVITCAVTGGAHTPSMSDALPVTPEEIADSAVAAAEAGAAILHLHARVPQTGQPTGDPEVYARFLPVIRQRTDAGWSFRVQPAKQDRIPSMEGVRETSVQAVDRLGNCGEAVGFATGQ